MKEICIILRREKVELTKRALDELGLPSMTIQSVEGRGKQRGSLVETVDTELSDCFPGKLKVTPTPSSYALEHALPKPVLYVPKKMITMVVPDDKVKDIVQAVIKVNYSGKPGDGKIFVMPIEKSYRVRTAEEDENAI